MNNLDPAVAERPEELIVYGGGGKAARDWPSYHRIVSTLQRLENDETLLVQSGKPVGVFRTHEEAPRVLIANANLVPRWANWDEFRRLDALGLTMYGQMTAGSWIYIGTQGILQGTYETFAECARQHFGGSLAGRLVVTGGLGGMGGAQPLAATMNGAAFLGVDVDATRIQRRVDTGYCDAISTDLDEALALVERARAERRGYSVGLVGNIAEVLPELVRRGVTLDVVTDQTSAHDLRVGYIPIGTEPGAGGRAAGDGPEGVRGPGARLDGGARQRDAASCSARGAVVFDYGNNLRGQVADLRAMPEAFDFPGIRPGVHPAAVLPWCRPVPLGGALGKSEGHRGDRRRRARDLSQERGAGPLDSAGPREGPLPGSPGANLLAGIRRARRDGAPVQLAGQEG